MNAGYLAQPPISAIAAARQAALALSFLMIFSPPGIVTGDGYPVLRDRRDRDIPIFEASYPQLRGKIETQLLPPGPWLPDEEKQQPAQKVSPGR